MFAVTEQPISSMRSPISSPGTGALIILADLMLESFRDIALLHSTKSITINSVSSIVSGWNEILHQ